MRLLPYRALFYPDTTLCPSLLFFFNDTATTEIYTLSLHDALPIWLHAHAQRLGRVAALGTGLHFHAGRQRSHHLAQRSEEHTSELQSPDHLVCRLLLEKKKNITVKTQKERPLETRLHSPQ